MPGLAGTSSSPRRTQRLAHDEGERVVRDHSLDGL